MTEKEIERWWDDASEYYQKEISGDDLKTVHYGPFGSTERRLKLLGNVKGKHVLELGCGGGQVSISLAKKGAICTGLDISQKQLDYAKYLANKNNVKVDFIKGTFSNLNRFRTGEYDIIISVFALQYASDLSSILNKIPRLLKQKGVFVFSLDHPFYMTVDPSTIRMSESYYAAGKHEELEKWPDGTKHKFIMYRRTVSELVNSILNSGLRLVRLIEPLDLKDEVWGAGYRRKLVKMITPTLIFKCVKT